ncbi:0be2b1dd-6915-45d8-ad9d-99ca3d8c7d51 [Thermothielavioides terrestris]|uniref:0be2b1dd-6915-45d8-ad9d-99ca3d8c7d51 n=1 Tax=Thermothielavioides terrestris TaxID=2587410 RepID=A0A446BV34_9PEZI|nr:0be2b1dd-6915-45d8-ad9d-99ca3d8c7d51 [Thermothielavioides terrestris]
MRFTILAAALFSVGALASTPDPMEGFNIQIMQWHVQVFPGGPTIVLNGTAEEVHKQLLKQNPHWDIDLARHAVSAPSAAWDAGANSGAGAGDGESDDSGAGNHTAATTTAKTRHKRAATAAAAAAAPAPAPADAVVEKRATFEQGHYFCGGRWEYASFYQLMLGVQYLRRIGGPVHLNPGPSNCARVSCAYDAAIWVCNDNPTDWVVGSFGEIADGADILLNNCGQAGNGGQGAVAAGQIFHPDNWNVIMRADSC